MSHPLTPKAARLLPEELRAAFAEPFGDVVDNAGLKRRINDDDLVFAVGDVVSLSLKGLGIQPKIWIGDYKTQRGTESTTYREALSTWGDTEYTVANPAGSITRDAWDTVVTAMAATDNGRIIVDGEEDLLGIPCFLEAPDGALVVYGMPGRGAVVVKMDAEKRAIVAAIVEQMPEA